MSTTKKILTAVFSILIIAAFALVLTWGIINFSKVKDGMSGSGIYTQSDVQNAYEDGYNTALADKEGYDKLIDSYRDTITTQNDLIAQLNSEAATLTNSNREYITQIANLTEQRTTLQTQIETLNTVKANNEATIAELNEQVSDLTNQVLTLQANGNENANQIKQLNNQITNLQSLNAQLQATNELNLETITSLGSQIVGLNNRISELTLHIQNNSTTVNSLNAKITELQKSISYYEQYLASMESGEQVVVTFEFAGSVYNIQVINKNSLVTVTQPQSTAYVIFNGWTVDGEAIDLSTYRITANTKIIADVTYKYEVNFMVDGENYNNQIVLKDGIVTVPDIPVKTGYVFDGWLLDGITVDLNAYKVTQNVTFTAKFAKLYSVIFRYEDTTLLSDTVKSGNFANEPETVSTNYKVFKGWKVNGVKVNVSTYKITADTVFVADITYKFDVKFMSDEEVYDTQIIERNGKITVPTAPTKSGYVFVGWSIDGTETVNVENYIVTENVTFNAIFRVDEFTVTFKSGGIVLESQKVQNGGYAVAPNISASKFVGWSVDDSIVDLSKYAITENVTFIAVFGKTFSQDSSLFGSWIGSCVGENAEEGNAEVFNKTIGGSPLDIIKKDSSEFYFMSTSGKVAVQMPLQSDILSITDISVKFRWRMHSNYVFELYYDEKSDTLVGTVSITLNGETKIYDMIFTRSSAHFNTSYVPTHKYSDYV